jgi:putative ABC transport system permease protein
MPFFRSISHSFRTLMRAPGFTAAAMLLLVMGIAANTIIFTLVDQLLLNPFPYREPERLVMIWGSNPSRGGIAAKRVPVAWSNFDAWRKKSSSFEDMEAYEIYIGYNLTGRGTPERLAASRVTPGFFDMIGIKAMEGRTFVSGDDTPNGDPIVVLTYTFAKSHFGDQSPINQRLSLDGTPYTVVGVLPKQFHLPAIFEGISEYKPDIWIPLPRVAATDPPQLAARLRLVVWGRLKPTVSLERARAEMTAIAEQRKQEDPDLNKGYGVNIFSLEVENTLPDFRDDLRLYSIAAFVVLLLACINLAGLVKIRSAVRRRNFAIMAALGASRRALIWPVVAESLILALLSGVFAFVASYGGVHLIAALKPGDILGPERLTVNLHTFIFANALSLATVLFVGFLPARSLTKGGLTEAVNWGSTTRTSRSYGRVIVVSLQIGVAVSLSITAMLLLRSFQRLLNLDQGFSPQQTLMAHLALPPHRYNDVSKRLDFSRQLLSDLRALPGVESAALVDNMPMYAIRITPFEIEGRPAPERNMSPFADFAHVTPDFSNVMKIGLREGRFFTEQEAETNPPTVVVVNEALARQFWPNQSPIGSHIRPVAQRGPPGPWQTVVGVVRDFRQFNTETPARPELLWPAQAFLEMTAVLRVNGGDPAALSLPLQHVVWNLDHDQPVADVQTLGQMMAVYNTQRRFTMLIVAAFAVFSVLLIIVGVYGLTSSFISSHTREIGIRLALGAQRGRICLSLVRPALIPVLTGIALGLLLSFLVKRLIAAVLFQVSPLDLGTYLVTPTALLLILLIASVLATLRAVRIDPARVLRED